MVQTIIFNQSDIETVQPAIGCTEAVSGKVRSLRRLLTIPRIYRKELRMARALARFIDAHPTLTNIWIGGWAVAGIYIIFIYG